MQHKPKGTIEEGGGGGEGTLVLAKENGEMWVGGKRKTYKYM